MKKIYISLIVLASALIGGFVFIKQNPLTAANFADDVLRPLIGPALTVKIEAIFFNIEDNINRIQYSFRPPVKNTVSFSKVSVVKIPPEESFTLDSIPLLSSFPKLLGEGDWNPINTGSNSGETTIAQTFVRPDPIRSYAIVYLVKMDMAKLNLSAAAGTREPGGFQSFGSGRIPKNITESNLLVAAFNGGFKRKDGNYGMFVDGKFLVPMQNDLATLFIYKDSKPEILRYANQSPNKNIIALRQNGPMLIEDSKIVTSSNEWNMQTWGLTTTNSMYTWRSGIGITKNGNLIYAVGSSLVPETLAKALLSAGAVNAMQLDINLAWVRFIVYKPTGNGKYKYFPLTKDLINGGYQFLNGYQKDFFYVYKNSS